MKVHKFCFNPFQENTYILEFDDHEIAIVDPGMYSTNEQQQILHFINENKFQAKWLLNTHAHLDHVFGNAFCATTFNLELYLHQDDLVTLAMGARSAALYSLNLEESPQPAHFFTDGQIMKFNNDELEVRHCPGHCPGHVVLIHHKSKTVIGGDVLFQGSVGRTDLPGGNAAQLDQSIRKQLYSLPEDYVVHPGHGESTTIGEEKRNNYFVFEGGSRLV